MKSTIIRLHLCGFIFTPKLLPTLLFFIIFPLLILLGFSQLSRYETRSHMLAAYQQYASYPAIDFTDANIKAKRSEYYPVKITGHYDNAHNIILDNCFYQKKLGYEVLTPFVISRNKEILLVNRGWRPRGWEPKGIKPEKNLGYALQWFSLALTFAIIYIAMQTTRGARKRNGKLPF